MRTLKECLSRLFTGQDCQRYSSGKGCRTFKSGGSGFDIGLLWEGSSRFGAYLHYIDQEVLFHLESFYGTKRIMKLLTGVGERWTYGMEPGQVESHLERYGLQLQKDLAASDYRRLYYGEESAEMRGYEFY